MKDVYNRTVFDRNSINGVPSGYIDDAANNLYRFLGSFWRNIHEGRALVRGLQSVRGIKAAQFYLDLLETLNLQDRKGMPVFHRELWKPLVLRLSKRNTSQENVLKLDGTAVIGEQPEGSIYGEGATLEIGSLASLDKYVTYPVDAGIELVAGSITNGVINPTVSYSVTDKFPEDGIVYTNGTLIFPKELDPFAEDSAFDVYDVVDDVSDSDVFDKEVVLWASDVLIDKNYLSDHMAYALGISCKSTEIAKRILNAGWDTINCGLTPELFRVLLAAMANIPVIQETSEKVIRIDTVNGDHIVTTDGHKYTVFAGAELRDSVKIGAVLNRGDFLDKSIKIYPLLTDVSEDKLKGITEYADILKTDVPVISVPGSLLRTPTANGLFVDWTPAEVMYNGDDKNGHRKLSFDLGGPEEDVDAFWEDVWEYAEANNIDLDDIFADCEYQDESSSSDSPEDPEGAIEPSGDMTGATDYANITNAITAAGSGGRVELGSGDFYINQELGLSTTVTLTGQGWTRTTLHQTGEHCVVSLKGGATLSRMTITGGYMKKAYGCGAGIYAESGTISWCRVTRNKLDTGAFLYGGGIGVYKGSGVSIDHCIIDSNEVIANTFDETIGGGIGIKNPGGDVTIDTCLVYGNITSNYTSGKGQGGGIGINFYDSKFPVTIRNTTVVNNSAGENKSTESVGKGGALYSEHDTRSKLTVLNCIFSSNETVSTDKTIDVSYADGIDYCLFDSDVDTKGTHSIVGDPMFVDPSESNFALDKESPAVGSGIAYTGLNNDLSDRSFSRPPSIGCYEYHEPAPDPAPDPSWLIVPAEFFLRYLIGGNTLIVTLDRNQLEDTSLIMDPMFFNLLNDAIPSGMRLFFVEHVEVGDDGDTYDTEETTEDEADTYVLEDIDEDEVYYNNLPGMRGKHIPSYEDQVEMKFFRNRKRQAN